MNTRGAGGGVGSSGTAAGDPVSSGAQEPLLRQRLISGTLLAALIIALLVLDGWLSVGHPLQWTIAGVGAGRWLCQGAITTLLALVFAILAARELLRLARRVGLEPPEWVVLVFVAGLVIGPYVSCHLRPLTGWHDESWGMLWLAVGLGLAFLMQARRRQTQQAMANLAVTLFIIYYAGGLVGFMTKLRMEVGGPTGVALLLFSVFVIKMTDVGAYFTGRLIGRRKLVPWLSPHKTWEGFIGGMLVAVVCAVGAGRWLHGWDVVHLPYGPLGFPWGLIIFGVLMALVSVAGDLCASLLKRDAAVKDSGAVIPGMGGILDVLDSPLLGAPLAWFFWTRLPSG